MITIDPRAAPELVKQWLETVQPEIEADLRRRLEHPGQDPGRLREAMLYAAMGPGKRLRPAVSLAACVAVGADRAVALPAASAMELLHTYTLVHDDLPALDNDDSRRGRPTVHVVFGEATAILTGDALLTLAFEALAELGERAAAAVAVLGRRAGSLELIAGQAHDLELTACGRAPLMDELELLHRHKTGALFSAAAELGGIAGGASATERELLSRYGMALGIAFQHADDRDDQQHAAHAAHARRRMRELTAEAVDLARTFGERGRELLALASWFGNVA